LLQRDLGQIKQKYALIFNEKNAFEEEIEGLKKRNCGLNDQVRELVHENKVLEETTTTFQRKSISRKKILSNQN